MMVPMDVVSQRQMVMNEPAHSRRGSALYVIAQSMIVPMVIVSQRQMVMNEPAHSRRGSALYVINDILRKDGLEASIEDSENDDNVIMIVGCVFLMVAWFGSFFSLIKRDQIPPKNIFILNGFKLWGVILFLAGSILMMNKLLYTKQNLENIESCLTPFQILSGFDSKMNKECADLTGVDFVQGQDSITDLNKQYERFVKISYGIIGKWNTSLIDYYHGAICYITGSIFFLVEGILYFALSLKENCA